MKRLRVILLGLLAPFSIVNAAVISDFSPVGGPPGETVTVTGEGFSDLGTVAVRIGNTDTPALVVDDKTLYFAVPAGADSGVFALIAEGSVAAESPFPFQVRREIPVMLDLPAGLPDTYTIVAGRSVGSPVSVPKNTATLVWAVPDSDIETAPFFAAIALPSDAEVTISLSSTARALPFLSPFLGNRETSRAEAIRHLLAELPEVTALEQAIAAAVGAGIPYLNDARVETALRDVIETAMESLPLPIPAATAEPRRETRADLPPPDTRGLTLQPLNPQSIYTEARLELKPRNLSAVLKSEDVPNAHLLTLDTVEGGLNPVDWIVEIYEIHPRSIPGGLSSLNDLSPDDPLEFFDARPLAGGHVRAKLASAQLDIFGRIGDFLVKTVNPFDDPRLGPNDFLFDRETPGVYVVQAYSGNLWYGTTALLEATNQVALLDEIDPNGQWASALATNVVVAAFDVVSVAVDVQDFLGKSAVVDIAQGTFTSVSKTLAVYNETEGVTFDLVMEALQSAQKVVRQKLARRLLKDGAENAASQLVQGVGKTLLKIFDISGKISTAEQALERAAGLMDIDTFAVERTLVAVRNPFVPEIRSFSPGRGQGGETVRLSGHGFGFPLWPYEDHENEDIEVSLCTFPATSTDPDHPEPPTARIELEVVRRHENQIEVRIPLDFGATFPEGAHFCIETASGLAVSREIFEYVPPPALTAVEPAVIFYYNNISLRGENFQPHSIAIIDDFREMRPTVQTPDRLVLVFSPGSTLSVGEHTVKVKTGERETAAVSFTVQTPTQAPPDDVVNGVEIHVTTAADIVAEDGEMSLREAILIANGNRGVMLERHLDCEIQGDCPRRDLDIDHVTGLIDVLGRVGGPSQIDTILVSSSLGVLTIDSDLPSLGPWDTIRFRNVPLDASAASTGLRLSGADGIAVHDAVILNASGPAVHATDGTDGAAFVNLKVSNCGSGILVDGDSNGNSFSQVTIENAGGHSVHFTGGSDGNTIGTASITDSGGHGIFLEGEAELNRFFQVEVLRSAASGVRLSGAGVRYNQAIAQAGFDDPEALFAVQEIYRENAGFGLLIENGASFNTWGIRHVMNNTLGGVCIRGPGTSYNQVGKTYRESPAGGVIPGLIYFNGGPGLILADGASHNSVSTLNIAANEGDGILVDNAHENVIATILSGEQLYFYDPEIYTSPPPAPNKGSSIRLSGGATGNAITAPEFHNSFNDLTMPNVLQYDLENGIVMEGVGTEQNLVHRTIIRDIGTVAIAGEAPPSATAGNGIELRGGASHNRIGEPVFADRIQIENVAGAGILIRDAATIGNVVAGCQTVWEAGAPLHDSDWAGTGVYLYSGARGNRIGVPGPTIGRSSFGISMDLLTNDFSGAAAGIVIDGAGGSVDANGDRVLPNIIASNRLTGPVGLLITGGAEVNDIGGTSPPVRGFYLSGMGWYGDANIFNVEQVGIKIDSTPLSHPAARNRFMNNVIIGSISSQDPVPPLTEVPPSVGLLVTGDSDRHQFGEEWNMRNMFDAVPVPVYIDGCTGVELYATEAGYLSWTPWPANLVLLDAEDCVIGDGTRRRRNAFTSAGITGDGGTANIVVIGGSGNRIAGNMIEGGRDHGVLIEGGSSNLVGSNSPAGGNTIVAHAGSGIVIVGPNAWGNRIQHNFIGETPDGMARPNEQHGIALIDQAAGTLVGGRADVPTASGPVWSPAPNTISQNLGFGVRVSDTGSTGNSILYNAIYANGLGGIQTANLGNDEIPPPTAVQVSGSVATGEVDSASAPAGSVVQLFSDAGLQGEVFLGEGEVPAGGAWEITGLPPAPLAQITATVTAPDGSTSAFGQGSVSRGFLIERTDGSSPIDRSIAFDHKTAVLPFSVQAIGEDVKVARLIFAAAGTLDDVQGVQSIDVYRDSDGSGTVTPADARLSKPGAAYGADNGTVVVEMDNGMVVSEDGPVHWLVAYRAGGGAAAGQTFQTSIESPSDVTAVSALAGFPVTAGGIFPIRSDWFTIDSVALAADFAQWRISRFGDAAGNDAIAGLEADPDGDGVVNGFEFAFGLDPLKPDRERLPVALDRVGSRLHFRFERPMNQTGVAYYPSVSHDLSNWSRTSPSIESISAPMETGDGMETITVIVNPGSAGEIFVRLEAEIEL